MRHNRHSFVPTRSSPLSHDSNHASYIPNDDINEIQEISSGKTNESSLPMDIANDVSIDLAPGLSTDFSNQLSSLIESKKKPNTPINKHSKSYKKRKQNSRPKKLIRKQKSNSDNFSSSEDESSDDYNAINKHKLPDELLTRLKNFPLFKTAPKSFHTIIASKLKLMQYHAQEYIVKKGESSKAMYWILKGTVGVTSTDGESTYAELAPGSYFGEIGILFNRPRTATVVSRTKVLVGVLTADALNFVLPDYPVIERRIRDEAQERLAMQDKRNKYSLPLLPLTRSNSVVAANASLNDNSTDFSNSSENWDQFDFKFNPILASESIIPAPSLPPIYPPSKSAIGQGIDQDIDSSVSIRDFLKNLPMFKPLNSSIIHELALGVEPKIYKSFETIFSKGDRGNDIFFIVSGEVEVIDLVENTKSDRVLARLGPGQYFGEMSFLASLNEDSSETNLRSATIRTISTVDLLVVKSDQVVLLCGKFPLLLEEFKRTAGERCKNNSSSGSMDSQSSYEGINYSNRISVSSLITPPQEGGVFDANWNMEFNEGVDLNNDFEENSVSLIKNDLSISPITKLDTKSKTSPIENSPLENLKTNEFENIQSPLQSPKFERSDSIFTFDKSFLGKSIFTTLDDDSNSFPNLPHDKSIEFPINHDDQNAYNTSKSINLSLPPLNPVPTPINNFKILKPAPNFHYMPHSKRLKLASVQGRRKSSVLSTGPLPDRILIKIFEFLTLPELMKIRLVCSRWRQLLHVAPNLFRELNLRPWNTAIDDKALIAITDFVGVRPVKIDISDCFHVTDEGFCYLVNEVGIGGSIQSLKMKSNWEISAMAIMDIAAHSVGKDLIEIDLSNCRKVRDDVVERLLGWNDSIPKNSVVTNGISNRSAVGGNDAFEPLPEMEAFDSVANTVGCKKLKKLNLGYCKHLTDKIMYHIAIHANERLESLNLTRCTSITDNGFNYWSYQPFPNLVELSLTDCTFLTDKSIVSIACSANNLKILNLNFCCALSDVSIEVLCLNCPNLEKLDLSFCGSAVSDASLVIISLHLQNLKELHIKGCVRVTRAGIDALLSGCPSLRYINISQCRNAHIYPGGIFAQLFSVKPGTRSAFVTAGTFQRVVEIVL